ncbi:hypothetical protein BH09PAT2_BH09PAT2_08680 [soil metagenome]
MMNKYLQRLPWILCIISFFSIISIIFHFPLWKEFFQPYEGSKLVLQGEYPVYEFVAETVRNNILSLHNPFRPTENVLFPFGWQFALDDGAPINGFYFIILRLFFSVHQSLLLIALLSVILSAVSMYYLLRILKKQKIIAAITAAIFAFTPFVSLRLPAHPTYVALYLFPIAAICFLKIINTAQSKRRKKYLWSALLGLSIVLFVLTNLYFTVMFGIMLLLIGCFFYPHNHLKLIKSNIRYFLVALIVSCILLIPWIHEVYRILAFSQSDKPKNLFDMTTFSADIINIFIPSSLNPFYKNLINILSKKYLYIQTIFENFTYPGVLILFGCIAYFLLRKRINKNIYPIFLTTISFFILTLGPFLKTFGTNLHIPLPYLIIAYTPLLQMARSPGRFIVPFIFLSAIIFAFLIEYILQNRPKVHKVCIIGFLFIIFLLDQYIAIQKAPIIPLPNNIYTYLARQPPSPLLEVPFSIRDSLKSFGHYHTQWSSYAQLFHHQPIFGIYAGRVPNRIYAYYTRNPLLNPIGRIVDINTRDINEISEQINFKEMGYALNLYGVKYSVIKMDESYALPIVTLLQMYGFKERMIDGDYMLWEREVPKNELTQINFQSPYQEIALGSGWSPDEPKDASRWMMGKKTRVFLRLEKTNKKTLVITGESIVEAQTLNVYINNIYVGEMRFETGGYSDNSLNVKNYLKKGLNTVTLYSKNTHLPSKFIPNSLDDRPLTLHVRYIGLE